MRVVIMDAQLGIEDADNLAELAVVTGLSEDQIDSALRSAGLGHAAGGHAWLRCADLEERAAPLVDDPHWRARFSAMLAYARSKGWVDDRGEAVRAHIIVRH